MAKMKNTKKLEEEKYIKAMPDEIKAYESIKNTKEKFGAFHKTCFHIHTPESYDYRLIEQWTHADYEAASEDDVLKICIERNVLPKEILALDSIALNGNLSCYSNKKEMLSYLLLAETIRLHDIEVVLVTDHHTVGGVIKLKTAIYELDQMKKYKVYPEVLLGIEISCADKNHIVGIFEDNQNNINKINEWLNENLLSIEDGSYKTSIEVLKFIESISGIGYIAHIDTSDIFKEQHLSGAYKKTLFSDYVLQMVGLSNYERLDYIKNNIKKYRSSEIKFVIDNDAHDIDAISNNNKTFWIKGSKRQYSMIKEAFNDYDISVSFRMEETPKQYIKGIYIENRETGFLHDKDKPAFCLNFSNALNCIIGGRGTGKSTVLELLEYILSQRCESDRELDFICSHGNTWLLYNYHNDEYLIEMRMPIKQRPDDNILRCFGQNRFSDRYDFKYDYNKDQVKNYALKHYFKISKIVIKDDTLYLNTVKKEMLHRFFDVKYSINELVNTASGEKINSFIFDTLFENKILSKPEDVIRCKKKSGLQNVLNDIQKISQKRKEEVDSIITPFNESQRNILRIIYSQKETYLEPDFSLWLFCGNYNKKRYYKKYNITEENIIEFLLSLCSKLGIFNFLKLILDEDTHRAIQEVDILEFCTEMNQNMVEQEITGLDTIKAHSLVKEVFAKLVTDQNIESIIDYLKKYVRNLEHFSLEFNINNKEGSSGSPIYKSVKILSLGQKVVAMLSFILGYSEYSKDFRPLIIDQPEDNLDNQYIYKNLVKQLRSIKEKRQVILATHNATIVTNAKADQVCIMQSNNQHGWIETTGYPGETRIKKQIINYLEGGKESFLHKMSIYTDALSIKLQN